MDKEKSARITKGLRESFRSGTAKIANRACYGYTHDKAGNLLIYAPEADIVRRIFSVTSPAIAYGKSFTHSANRKSLLLLGLVGIGKQVRNQDAVSQYIYERNHPPIISGEVCAQAQITRLGRSKAMQRDSALNMVN
jgi:hypothetical protein